MNNPQLPLIKTSTPLSKHSRKRKYLIKTEEPNSKLIKWSNNLFTKTQQFDDAADDDDDEDDSNDDADNDDDDDERKTEGDEEFSDAEDMKSALEFDEGGGGSGNSSIDDLQNKYMKHLLKTSKIPFGVYLKDNKMHIGNSRVKIIDDVLHIKDSRFNLTPGLLELIFKRIPNKNIVLRKDVEDYNNILDITNAHRRGFSPNGQLSGDRSVKYQCYIKQPQESKKHKEGGCLNSGRRDVLTTKTFYPKTDYIYWDDPNELVSRLQLLIASQNAGNTSHSNEINAIVEELTESGIILK